MLLIVLSACAQQDPFTVGAILHLTGDQASVAEEFLHGMELAVDDLQSQGRDVMLIVEDDKLQPKEAHTAAVKLAEVNNIDAMILASYLEGMAAGPYLEEQGINSIVLWDSAADLENIGEHIFGMGIWTPSAGEAAADFAYNELQLREITVITNQNEWSEAVGRYFTERFEEFGGKVLLETSLPPDTSDFRTVLLKTDPEGYYAPLTNHPTDFYTQKMELGLDQPVLTSDILTKSHIEAMGEAATNIYQTQARTPNIDTLSSAYRKKYGDKPEQPLFVAWGYDAVQILYQTQGTTEQLYNITYQGFSGVVDFNENGSSKTYERVHELVNGTFIAR